MFIMETMERKKPRRRRAFTPEFKADIVERCRAGDRSIGQVARDFDLTETAVRSWVSQAETDAGERPGLTTAEREELARLRREDKPARRGGAGVQTGAALVAARGPEGRGQERRAHPPPGGPAGGGARVLEGEQVRAGPAG